jgi:hypothetical protein
MKSRIVLLACLIVVVAAVPSWAQYSQSPRGQGGWGFTQQQHRIELLGYGGYAWSDAVESYYLGGSGEVDITSGGIWGIEADINARPGAQLVLLYNRQDSELTFKHAAGLEDLEDPTGDIAIEYWQIGGLGGVQQGNIMPFTMLTLGGTRIIFTPKSASATDDEWYFSIILGIGAKIYVNERIGLRVQGRLPWTFNTSGAAAGFGGRIVQADVSGGLFIMF